MNLIKLDATESTNTFLKELIQKNDLDNFTVVKAAHQLKGRGQMGSSWCSDKGKNLIFSVFVKFVDLDISNRFYISKAVSVAVFDGVKEVLGDKIAIKWPNDILADKKKISGILIENSIKKNRIVNSVIGIGLNVNQDFFEELPNATSIKLILGQEFELDVLLDKIVKNIKDQISYLNNREFDLIDSSYANKLFNLNKPAMYRNLDGSLFMGKIINVTLDGKLQMEMLNESIREFGLKEFRYEL